nr:ABC transporter ATP-binding protein [candidate division Zixibacteria bacterium]
MTDNQQPVISIKDMSFSYNGRPALENVNLVIDRNDFIWVVGPNGGGKTTMIKLILGLLQPQKGTVRVFGQNPNDARDRIGYMPQFSHLDPQFPVTVLDVVLIGRLGGSHKFGPLRQHDRFAAEKALGEVSLLESKNRPFSELSGGQQRRVLIARALACEPALLVLDEPMANLDLVVEKELNDLLLKLNQKLTVLMVSHDPALVSEHIRRVVCVNRTVSEHPTCELDSDFIGELYGGERRLVRHDQHIHGRKNGA